MDMNPTTINKNFTLGKSPDIVGRLFLELLNSANDPNHTFSKSDIEVVKSYIEHDDLLKKILGKHITPTSFKSTVLNNGSIFDTYKTDLTDRLNSKELSDLIEEANQDKRYIGYANAGTQGLASGFNIYAGYKALQSAKVMNRFQQQMALRNLQAQTKAYNFNLGQTLSGQASNNVINNAKLQSAYRAGKLSEDTSEFKLI